MMTPRTRSVDAVPARSDTTFVGRRAEFERLEQVWAAVEDHRRQVVFVGGEPGVGKTHLVSRAAAVLRANGACVLWGACQADFDIPYRPFVTMLEQVLDETDADVLGDVPAQVVSPLLRLTPRVRLVWPGAAEPPPDERESRPGLFDAVVRVLVAVAEQRPTVLVLEDLHWAAEPTLAMLTQLVQSTAGEQLLILGTRRTTAPDRTDAVTFTLADLHRLEGVDRIDLDGLSTADVADYLVRDARVSLSSARAVAPVLRDQTGGNPFFLREYWQDLQAHGGVAAVRSPTARAPRSIQDALERRLAAMGPAPASVLEVAAVVGDVVDPAVTVQASDLAPEQTLEGLDYGVRAGLLVANVDREGHYGFTHALARQAVLDRMSASARAAVHARVAQAMETRGGGTDPALVPQLAHHYLQARVLGYAPKAAHYLTLAARQAERSIAYAEAATLYERAARVGSANGVSRVELLLAAGRSHMHAGDFATARALFEELASSEDPEVRLQAAIAHEDASWRPGTHGQRSLELLAQAIDGTALDLRDHQSVRALASMGRAFGFTGDFQGAREQGERALQAARALGDEELVAHALGATLWQGMTPALAPHLLERAVELQQIGSRLGDDDHLGPAAFHRGVFAYLVGDQEQWAAAQRDLTELALAGGQPFFRYVAGCSRYAHRFAVGDFGSAEHIVGWLEEFSSEFNGATDGSSGVQQFMLRRVTGNLHAVRGLITGTEDLDHHWPPGLLALYTALEMWEPAARVLRHLCDRVDEYRASVPQWAGVMAYMTDAAVGLGDTVAAALLRPLVAEYSGTNLIAGQFVAVFGSADRYLAELDSVLGDVDANRRFEQALAMDRRMGAITHQVETLAAWGRHATRHPGATSGPTEAELTDEARALARRIGHRQILRDLGAESPPATSNHALPRGLTERELDVLRLVAQGLSNREIGDRLFISANTAANHVRSILAKTNAPNRTKAAIFAADHGLLEAR